MDSFKEIIKEALEAKKSNETEKAIDILKQNDSKIIFSVLSALKVYFFLILFSLCFLYYTFRVITIFGFIVINFFQELEQKDLSVVTNLYLKKKVKSLDAAIASNENTLKSKKRTLEELKFLFIFINS